MSLQLTSPPTTTTTAPRPKRSRGVIAFFIGRKAARSGAGWGVVIGLYVATQALAYATSYKTVASRHILVQEFGHNAGISALVGPANDIGTVPGYTAWKCLTVIAIIGAVLGILTSTKLTRGEEDAGRWELLAVGPVTRRGATTQALIGLALGAAALFATSALLIVWVGHSSKVGIGPGAALYFTLAAVSGAIVFLAVGTFSAQLATSRRQAAGFASGLLGISYALRMVADSSSGLAWLRWATPLGWIEELQPLTAPRPIALVPLGALVALLVAATLYLAGQRDIGTGSFSDNSNVARQRRLPTNRAGLPFYLSRTTLLAWAGSIFAYGLLLGGIAKSGGKIITSSASLSRAFARLGVSGAEAYLSVSLLIMAVAVSFVAIGQASAARKEESSGQLDNLLVAPYSRTQWLGERVALGVGAVLVAGELAGIATWIGATLDRAHVSLSSMVGAGLNLAIPALVIFGVATLTFGVRPRWQSAVAYGLFVWSLLVEIVGSVAKLNHWVLDLSVFHQMTAAPATPVDWTTDGMMAAIALAALAGGATLFRRRDLKGE